MSEKKKPTWEDAEKICEGFRSLEEALLEIEPYGIQRKAIKLLNEAREEANFALLFADAENPFLTDEAKIRLKMEYLEKEAKRLGIAWANADVDDITQLLAEVAQLTDLAAKIALSHPVGSPEYDLAFDIWSQNVAVANRTPAAYHRAIRAVKGASLPAKEEK